MPQLKTFSIDCPQSVVKLLIYRFMAVERNFEKWGYSFLPEKDLLYEDERKIGSYEAAVEQYETRLVRRMRWMDEHIEDLRSYSHESINKKFNH